MDKPQGWAVFVTFIGLSLAPMSGVAQVPVAAPTAPGLAAGNGPLTMSLSAIAEYQYDSNVFDLESGFSVAGLPPNPPLGDSIYTLSGAYDIKYTWQQQTVFADLRGGDVRYNYYSQLDHTEYDLGAGWSGKFGDVVDGNVGVVRDRSMIPFLDLTQSTLSVSTEQREQGGLGVQLQTRWRVEGSAYTRNVTWPLPEEPGLELNESEGQLALKYLGTPALTSGLSAAYIGGSYTGASVPALNPPYEQTSVAFLTNYIDGRSNFAGQVGYTARTSSGVESAIKNNISTVTGSLNYTNQITGKTSVQLAAARLINSYITNSGSEIDDSLTLAAHWQATYKISTNLGYSYVHSLYPDQGNNPAGSDRIDHVQLATLRVDYEALSWLAVKPYASYQFRSSNLIGGNFDAAIFGVDLTLQWQK